MNTDLHIIQTKNNTINYLDNKQNETTFIQIDYDSTYKYTKLDYLKHCFQYLTSYINFNIIKDIETQ